MVLGAQLMLAVDFSVLNVAMPVIGDGLGFAQSDLPWIVTAFMLPAADFTLMFGRVADLFGRRRLFSGWRRIGARPSQPTPPAGAFQATVGNEMRSSRNDKGSDSANLARNAPSIGEAEVRDLEHDRLMR